MDGPGLRQTFVRLVSPVSSLARIHFPTPQFFVFDPQTPGGARPRSLASSHKLGRAVALASPAAR